MNMNILLVVCLLDLTLSGLYVAEFQRFPNFIFDILFSPLQNRLLL